MGKGLLVIIGVSATATIVLVLLIAFVVLYENDSSDTGQNTASSRINLTEAVDIHDLEPQVNVTKAPAK